MRRRLRPYRCCTTTRVPPKASSASTPCWAALRQTQHTSLLDDDLVTMLPWYPGRRVFRVTKHRVSKEFYRLQFNQAPRRGDNEHSRAAWPLPLPEHVCAVLIEPLPAEPIGVPTLVDAQAECAHTQILRDVRLQLIRTEQTQTLHPVTASLNRAHLSDSDVARRRVFAHALHQQLAATTRLHLVCLKPNRLPMRHHRADREERYT